MWKRFTDLEILFHQHRAHCGLAYHRPTNIVSARPLYRENPDLPKGTIKQVDYAADGANSCTRTVYLHDQVYFSDAFYTHFEPWQAIFEYGPGTEGIPEQNQIERFNLKW